MWYWQFLQAFRKLYEEVGLGWVYAVTKYEPVSVILHDTDGCKGLLLSFQEHVLLFFFLLITKKPSHLQIATIADAIYSVWAKYRLQVTGKYSMHLPLSVIFGYNDLCFHFLIHWAFNGNGFDFRPTTFGGNLGHSKEEGRSLQLDKFL